MHASSKKGHTSRKRRGQKGGHQTRRKTKEGEAAAESGLAWVRRGAQILKYTKVREEVEEGYDV